MQYYILKSLYGKVNGKDPKSVNELFSACKFDKKENEEVS